MVSKKREQSRRVEAVRRSRRRRRLDAQAQHRNAGARDDGGKAVRLTSAAKQPASLKSQPGLRPVLVIPGAIGYRVAQPCGAPDIEESLVVHAFRGLKDASCLLAIPDEERHALVDSISSTSSRAEYHLLRFRALRRELDSHRQWAPGEVFWDATAGYVHYEFQAFAGAVRTLVDELIFIIASRHKHPLSNDDKKNKWKATNVFAKPPVLASLDVPEVHRLQAHKGWYELLNAYRNTAFHSGWWHGGGHVHDDGRMAAAQPERNGLLLPDRDSLRGQARPHQWTWKCGTTVDDVVAEISTGLEAVVQDLCEREWGMPPPSTGTIATEDRPNLLITFPVPLFLTVGTTLVVPVFSSRARADRLLNMAPQLAEEVRKKRCELIEVPSSHDLFATDTEVLSVSLAGLANEADNRNIRILLDPEPRDSEWDDVSAANAIELTTSDVRSSKFGIVGMPVEKPTIGFLWRVPFK